MRLGQVQRELGGVLVGDTLFAGVSSDSRLIQPGQWFVALRGVHHDGHLHAALAVQRGASALIVDHELEGLPVPQWIVSDTLKALQALAVYWRRQCTGVRRLALTGSSGKTTTKEMLARMLMSQGATRATVGNLNNHIGVPLTLLQLQPTDHFGVIELGANHEGEIGETAQWVEPECVAITNVGTAHLEGFGSREGIARGKSEIYAAVASGGWAVLNRDDDFYEFCALKAAHLQRVTVSLENPLAEVRVRDLRIDGTGCYGFAAVVQGRVLPWVQLPVMGIHNVLNACLALGMTLFIKDLNQELMVRALEHLPVVGGRMQREVLGALTLIDDTYNANPAAMRTAIEVLAQQPGKKILVLGDMAELGASIKEEHRGVGEWAAMKKIDALYAVGDYAPWYAEGFGQQARVVPDKQQLLAELHSELQGVISILVKGSRSSQMEDIVQGLRQKVVVASEHQNTVEDSGAC